MKSKDIKDAIIVCPTKKRAFMEWDRFTRAFAPAIKFKNKKKLSITMENGQKMFFVSNHEGRRMIVGFPNDFVTFSIETFKTMLKEAIKERVEKRSMSKDGKDTNYNSR